LVNNRCETESSGGITIDNIEAYAATGVQFISLGMLTHSVKSMDISFKIKL
jgi:nicotinate-nucleotide pyrophosphorylase (carboxylating)